MIHNTSKVNAGFINSDDLKMSAYNKVNKLLIIL